MTPSSPVSARAVPRGAALYPQLVEPGADALRTGRIRAGDEAAFESFFSEVYPALVAFLGHRTGSAALAEDIAQDTFVALWQRRADVDPARSLRSWVYRAALNRAVSIGRRRRLELRVREWLRPRASVPPTPDDELSGDELRTAIHAAVAALPARCREVFLLARDGGMSYAEIAATLGLSPKTVENHMGRAFKRLRAALQPFHG